MRDRTQVFRKCDVNILVLVMWVLVLCVGWLTSGFGMALLVFCWYVYCCAGIVLCYSAGMCVLAYPGGWHGVLVLLRWYLVGITFQLFWYRAVCVLLNVLTVFSMPCCLFVGRSFLCLGIALVFHWCVFTMLWYCGIYDICISGILVLTCWDLISAVSCICCVGIMMVYIHGM